MLLSFSSRGLGSLSQCYQDFVAEHICRGPYRDVTRQVLINNWEATYYDFNGEKLCAIAQQAKELGVEMLVLDLSRQDVVEYLYSRLSALLRDHEIRYVKWDMNRSLTDVFSLGLPAERQGEVAHRYLLGLYSLLERLTGEFPEVLFEGCSGGGGRFDAGMLAYFPQIWCSDDTDEVERLKIQYGTSFGYPIHVRLKGLLPEAMYRETESGRVYSGAALMYGGYTLPIMTGDYPGFQCRFERI